MWANAQRDGHPAKHMWRPLFNAAKFGWRPLVDCMPCSNAAKTRKPLKLAGCPKLVNRSHPLMGRSSPYCQDIWRKYCCLISLFFFWLSIHALVVKIQPDKVVRWCPDGEFWRFLCPVFSASRVQYISDLHSKFALRPHHVWKYGRHPICDGWD